MSQIWVSHVTCMNELWLTSLPNGRRGQRKLRPLAKLSFSIARQYNSDTLMSSAALVLCMWYVTCMNESCHTHGLVMSHVWMSHVAHMNELWITYNSDTLMSSAALVLCMWYITRKNESCDTYKWVMSHIWLSHVTHMNESCHTYEWVMSHIWMRHATYVNESCHKHEWVMSHTWMRHELQQLRDAHV